MKTPLRLLLPLALLSWAPLYAQDEAAPSDPAQPTPSEPTSERDQLVQDDPINEPAQWGRGPLEVAEPYILALSRARPWATSPETPGHLGAQIALRTVWANSYAFETNRFAIDAETRHVFLSARFGIGERFSLGLLAEYQWRGGGTLDGFIDDFHRAFGLPQADRSRRPEDRYLVTGLQADGQTTTLRHAGYGWSDLVLEGRANLLKGDRLLPALTATLRLRLPTGRGKFKTADGVDPTFQLDASKRLGTLPIVLYAGVAYTYHSQGRIEQLELYRHRAFGYLGLELEFADMLSFVVHVWGESPRERTLWKDRVGVPRTDLTTQNLVTYVAFGFKAEPRKGLIFELGVLENLVDPEVTADLGVMFNVTLQL